MLYLYCSPPGTHSSLACAELDSASNRHLLMRAVASLCALAGFDSEFLSQYNIITQHDSCVKSNL